MQEFQKRVIGYTVERIRYIRPGTLTPRKVGNGLCFVIVSFHIGGERRFFQGVSRCSKKDVFDKRLGRSIATARAVRGIFRAYTGADAPTEIGKPDEFEIDESKRNEMTYQRILTAEELEVIKS
jgi:hypothetical protein